MSNKAKKEIVFGLRSHSIIGGTRKDKEGGFNRKAFEHRRAELNRYIKEGKFVGQDIADEDADNQEEALAGDEREVSCEREPCCSPTTFVVDAAMHQAH